MGPQPGAGGTAPEASLHRPDQLSLWHLVNSTSSPGPLLPPITGWVPGTQTPVLGYLGHLININSGVLLSNRKCSSPSYTWGAASGARRRKRSLIKPRPSQKLRPMLHERASGVTQGLPRANTAARAQGGADRCLDGAYRGANGRLSSGGGMPPAHPARTHCWPVWSFVQAASPPPAPHQPPCTVPPRGQSSRPQTEGRRGPCPPQPRPASVPRPHHAPRPHPLRPSRQTPWMQGLLSHSSTSDRHVGSW